MSIALHKKQMFVEMRQFKEDVEKEQAEKKNLEMSIRDNYFLSKVSVFSQRYDHYCHYVHDHHTVIVIIINALIIIIDLLGNYLKLSITILEICICSTVLSNLFAINEN